MRFWYKLAANDQSRLHISLLCSLFRDYAALDHALNLENDENNT